MNIATIYTIASVQNNESGNKLKKYVTHRNSYNKDLDKPTRDTSHINNQDKEKDSISFFEKKEKVLNIIKKRDNSLKDIK